MKKIFDILYVCITAILVLVVSVSFFIIKDTDFSAMENRSLSSVPTLTAKKVISGEYTLQIGRYFADQFPFRDAFVSLKAYSEILQLKMENNGVILAENGIMIPRTEQLENRLTDNLNSISILEKNTGVCVCVGAIPRTVDVFKEYLPKGYSTDSVDLIWDEFKTTANNFDINCIDLSTTLCNSNEFYKTDHHYNSYGAYRVYTKLGEVLGYTPKAENSFEIQTVTNEFCGTSMRKSGFYLSGKDTIQLFRYEGDSEYKVVADGNNIELYDFGKLTTADKYAVFLGGNHGRVDLTLPNEDRKRILLIRDSYADSLVPFLAQHFDIIMIDLRYYSGSVAEIVKTLEIYKILVIESISELYCAKNLSLLKMP